MNIRKLEQTATSEKPFPGATGKRASSITFNRNHHLADQIFSNLNYAEISTKNQKLCRCGRAIPADFWVFNDARLCQFCKTKRNAEQIEKLTMSSPTTGQTFTGRIFRQRRCRKCVEKFFDWKANINCRQCLDTNREANYVD